MYNVIVRFQDLQDEEKHIYEVGDVFPHKADMKVSKERLIELAGNKNKIGKPLIEKVEVKEDVDVDGAVSRTKELVRPGSDEVAREVRGKRRKSDLS